eukprot:TRINITY_DN4007_c0_g2_i3.p1 TRINITY_DN4007_c0_g2~~TRINITY_DN4007_c0_g2_i3.p1  ORF type:complete len:125 (+),score=42.22 TRINITY_DN4007_c0_g2_i3:401-775(+)
MSKDDININLDAQGTEKPRMPVPGLPTTVVDEVPSQLKEKDIRLTKLEKGHYIKGNVFFFVGCMCAILAESKGYCVFFIYLVLLLKVVELAGHLFGFLWVSYIGHALVALVNYINIFVAIGHKA